MSEVFFPGKSLKETRLIECNSLRRLPCNMTYKLSCARSFFRSRHITVADASGGSRFKRSRQFVQPREPWHVRHSHDTPRLRSARIQDCERMFVRRFAARISRPIQGSKHRRVKVHFVAFVAVTSILRSFSTKRSVPCNHYTSQPVIGFHRDNPGA